MIARGTEDCVCRYDRQHVVKMTREGWECIILRELRGLELDAGA